jgi:hypothetical protein
VNYHGLSAGHFRQRSGAFFLELVLHMGDRQKHENTVGALFGVLFGARHAGRLTPAQGSCNRTPPPQLARLRLGQALGGASEHVFMEYTDVTEAVCRTTMISLLLRWVRGSSRRRRPRKTSRAGGVSSGVLTVCPVPCGVWNTSRDPSHDKPCCLGAFLA